MNRFCFKELVIQDYQTIVCELTNSINCHSFRDSFNYLDVNMILEKNPTFKKWLKDNDCVLNKAAIIVTTTRSSYGEPHIDSQENSLALNFPLSNCEYSYTMFYDPSDIDTIVDETKPNGVLYKKIIFKNTPREISRYILDRPILLNTHVPHKIFHNNEKSRYAVSFRFAKDPWHLIE